MSIHIRPMTLKDLRLGMRLKSQVAWNQLESDWRRTLELEPDGCFVASVDGTDAGTVATTRFGTVAWISLMLVDQAFRRRGIGRSLMVHAMAHLQAQECETIRLDATPLGRPLYESLGFRLDFELIRYLGSVQGRTDGTERESELVAPILSERWEDVIRLDRAASGADRSCFLEKLWREGRDHSYTFAQVPTLEVFCLGREGANGLLLGPCIGSRTNGDRLMSAVLPRYVDQSVIVDIPSDHSSSCRIVEAFGLSNQRVLARMTQGKPSREQPELIWSSSGPEKG